MNGTRSIAKRLGRGAHARTGVLMDVVRENMLLAAVAGIGFSVSFQTIAKLAVDHHTPGPPILYPIGIDAGILALIAESLLLIRQGRSDFVPRVLAWLLTGLTIYINAHGAAPGDRVGEGLHVVMPALWVTCLELVRHRKITAARSDGIPSGRWVAAPWATLTLWVRMRRDGITSYPLALEMEQARLFARDLIRAAPEEYRPHRSSLICKRIRSGRLREDVRKVIAGSLADEWAPGWEGAVTDWVTGALALPAGLVASLENAHRDITRSASAGAPAVVSGSATVNVPVSPVDASGDASGDAYREVPATTPTAPAAASGGASRGASGSTSRKARTVPAKATNDELAELVAYLFDQGGEVKPYGVIKAIKDRCGGKGIGYGRAEEVMVLAERMHGARVVTLEDRRRA